MVYKHICPKQIFLVNKMSTNSIKLVALLFMLIDHIGRFIVQSPIWFRYIGRLSAPLFFFCSAWGFYYTSNKKRYLIRLYVLGIVMSLVNSILYYYMGKEIPITNNIFVTIFLGCMVIYLFESADHWQKRIKIISLLLLQQIVAFYLCVVCAEIICFPPAIGIYMLYYGYGALFGSFIFSEGSVLFVLFFIAVYYLKERKIYLSLFVVVFTAFLNFMVKRTYYMRGPLSYLIPFDKYQWLMVLIIPFFFIYNGKKGKNHKWFYYLFYPLHIWVLYIVGCLMK